MRFVFIGYVELQMVLDVAQPKKGSESIQQHRVRVEGHLQSRNIPCDAACFRGELPFQHFGINDAAIAVVYLNGVLEARTSKATRFRKTLLHVKGLHENAVSQKACFVLRLNCLRNQRMRIMSMRMLCCTKLHH